MPPGWPSLKAKDLRRRLGRLGYRRVPGRGGGSHEILQHPTLPELTWAFHAKASIPPGLVRSILMKQIGLTEEQAREVVK